MQDTRAAKYLFAACLCASTVDLVLVDGVLGPMALRPEPSTTAAGTAGLAAAGTAGPAAAGTAATTATTASTSLGATGASAEDARPAAVPVAEAPRPPPRIVARFDSDQPAASFDDLPALAAAMQAAPRSRVVLEGHSDRRGDPVYNRTLSMDRAKWAQARLVALGVSEARIEVIGHGAERPLAESDDDASVASNRRVEARWLTSSPSSEDGEK